MMAVIIDARDLDMFGLRTVRRESVYQGAKEIAIRIRRMERQHYYGTLL